MAYGLDRRPRHSKHVQGLPDDALQRGHGYIDGGAVILDISDMTRPRLVSRWDYHPPFPGFTHTLLPLFDRGLLIVSDECIKNEGADWPKLVWVVDAREAALTFAGDGKLQQRALDLVDLGWLQPRLPDELPRQLRHPCAVWPPRRQRRLPQADAPRGAGAADRAASSSPRSARA